jgi:predicted dehydrogenase
LEEVLRFREMTTALANDMTVLIAGTGSIGRRHIDSLRQLAPAARFVFLRRKPAENDHSTKNGAKVVDSVDAALAERPALAVIAVPSAHHAGIIVPLLEAGIPMYIEKPVVATRAQWDEVARVARAASDVTTLCGCNLRFLPSLRAVRELVAEGTIGRVVRASLQSGQWLPDWRPSIDYRRSYSASRELGGGVVLDLVHELDAARWILGEFDSVVAVGGHMSSLEMSSEDAVVIGLTRARGPVVAVGLDYVARRPVRRYEFYGEKGTLTWDLPGRRVELSHIDGRQTPVFEGGDFDVAATYVRAMREFLEAVASGRQTSQNLDEGLRSAALAIKVNEEIRA